MRNLRWLAVILALSGCATKQSVPRPAAGPPAVPSIRTTFYGSSNDAVYGFVDYWHTVSVTGTNQGTIIFEDSPSMTNPVWTPVYTLSFVSGQVNRVRVEMTNDSAQQFERARLVTP